MKRNYFLSLAAGIAVSAIALYFALRNVPAADLFTYLTQVNYAWVLVSIVIALVSFGFRAYRWQIILGDDFNIGFWQAYHPLMIGFMINCVLPGRVGEVARPIILRQKTGVPFSTGIATVALERAFDFLLLIAMLAVVLKNVTIDPGLDVPLPEWIGDYHLTKQDLLAAFDGMLKLSFVLIAGIVMVGFETTRKLINKCIMAVPSIFFFAGDSAKNWIEKKICVPLSRLVENFALGFAQIKDPKTLLFCTGLSVVIWGLAALSYYAVALGCPGIDLSFSEIAAMMVIICFFIAMPSVPGYWGIWEAGGVFALYIFGVATMDAAGFTLVNHAIQTIPVMLLGFVSAFITGINILKVTSEDPGPSIQQDAGTGLDHPGNRM